jgi:hypothetical protein
VSGPRQKPHHPNVDRHRRNEYLRDLGEEYHLARKKQKTELLDEAVKRTGLVRKVLIRKLRHPARLVPKVRTQARRCRYDAAVRSALAESQNHRSLAR